MHLFAPLLALAAMVPSALAAAPTYPAPNAIKWKNQNKFINTTLAHGDYVFTHDHPPLSAKQQKERDRIDLKLSKADPIKTSACPSYKDQLITIQVHYRVFYYSNNGSKRREDGYLSEGLVKKNLAELNSMYAQASPKIKYVLGTGTKKTDAPLTYTVFTDKAEWDAFTLNYPTTQEWSDRTAAIAETARGPLSARGDLKLATRKLFVYTTNWVARGAIGFNMGATIFAPTLVDGVYINHRYISTTYDDNSYYQPNTLAHEAGHWQGIIHPFDYGGCKAGNTFLTGDRVTDTYPWADASQLPGDMATMGCEAYSYLGWSRDLVTNPCGGTIAQTIASTTNIMNNAYGRCGTKFTPGQIRRGYGYLQEARGFVPTCTKAS